MREDKLLKTAVSTIAISSLLVSIFVVAFSAEADPEVTWDFPRLDEFYMIEADNGFEAAKQCGIDCYQANSMAEVYELRGPPYYWNVSWTHGFNWCCHGFNCRDHPDHAGEYCWFFNRTNDFELYPLTLQDFRLALAYIVGTLKEPWISEIYGYICEPQYWFVPYANAYYVNLSLIHI